MSGFVGIDHAIILAGGSSRRMGQDKLRLPVSRGATTTVLQHVVEEVGSVARQVLVAGATVHDPSWPPHATPCPDPLSGAGPLAAIAHAWDTLAPHAICALVAGDLLGFNAAVLTACADALNQCSCDAVLVTREGRLQPLLGAYRGICARTFIAAAEAGETRLMRVVDRLTVQTIDSDAMAWPVWWTKPIHTPEDYEQWLAWVGAESKEGWS